MVKILNFNIFGKMIFFGVRRFCGYFLGVDTTNWSIFRGHFYAFEGLLLRSSYRMVVFFWDAIISKIFFRCLKFLIFIGLNGRCWARAYV